MPRRPLPRMARPLKAPEERRDERLPAPRMTAAELAFVEGQAASAGLGIAEYVRRRVLGRRIAPARPVADERLLLELNRVGVNLNQIARALNSDRPEQADLAVVLSDLREVLAVVAAYEC
jgi:hypothetical protein